MHKWEDNIKMDLKGICWEDIKRIDLGLKIRMSGSSCGHNDEPQVQ
jgi:hypothetical protein